MRNGQSHRSRIAGQAWEHEASAFGFMHFMTFMTFMVVILLFSAPLRLERVHRAGGS